MKKLFLFLFLLTFFSSSIVLGTGDAYANDIDVTYDTTGSMEKIVCNALGFLTGGVGKALAAFACIGVSMAFLAGKVAWTTILAFSVGMACIFGAPTIIKAFAGGDTACEGIQ